MGIDLRGPNLEVFSAVSIAQAEAGVADLGVGGTGQVVRLHALIGGMTAAGTVQIGYDDDGAGTTAVALSGAMPVAIDSGFVIPFNPDIRGALTTAADKHLTLTSVTGAFCGYAVISKGPA